METLSAKTNYGCKTAPSEGMLFWSSPLMTTPYLSKMDLGSLRISLMPPPQLPNLNICFFLFPVLLAACDVWNMFFSPSSSFPIYSLYSEWLTLHLP